MKNTHRIGFGLITFLLLAGCGQKGQLFLPGNPTEVRSDVPSTNDSTVPDEEVDEDDEPQP